MNENLVDQGSFRGRKRQGNSHREVTGRKKKKGEVVADVCSSTSGVFSSSIGSIDESMAVFEIPNQLHSEIDVATNIVIPLDNLSQGCSVVATGNIEESVAVLEVPNQENLDIDVTNNIIIPSNNRSNRLRLPPIKLGDSYPCGCGICDKSYINNGNIVLCYGCKSMYINKSCNRNWRCLSCSN